MYMKSTVDTLLLRNFDCDIPKLKPLLHNLNIWHDTLIDTKIYFGNITLSFTGSINHITQKIPGFRQVNPKKHRIHITVPPRCNHFHPQAAQKILSWPYTLKKAVPNSAHEY